MIPNSVFEHCLFFQIIIKIHKKMKSLLKNSVSILVVSILLMSCASAPSLQKYFVDAKENDQFIAIDLPASILQLKEGDIPEQTKKTLETIKKVNLLALQITETNKDFYTSEKEKVKKILKNTKYKELMRVKMGGANISVNFLGEEESIDEVIVFGSDNNQGFAIARVIGDNMNPSDVMEIVKHIELDGESNQLKQLEGLLGGVK